MGNKNKRIKSVQLAKGKESEKEKTKLKGGGRNENLKGKPLMIIEEQSTGKNKKKV